MLDYKKPGLQNRKDHNYDARYVHESHLLPHNETPAHGKKNEVLLL